MAKGGKGSKGPDMGEYQQMMQMMQAQKPKETPLQTTGWGGMGYNTPSQPDMPSWATGHFAMPWFGQASSGRSWDSQAQAPAASQQQPAQAQAQSSSGDYEKAMKEMEERLRRYYDWQQYSQDQDWANMMSRSGYSGGR